MKSMILSFCVLMLAAPAAIAGPGCCPQCGCPDGCYEEEITYHCRLVPDVKPIKKTVYECREVPYCQHKPHKLGQCDCCPECQACPKFKKVLVKREVTCGEKHGTKCVVEQCVRLVPKCCRHCGYLPPAPDVVSAPAVQPIAPVLIEGR